GRYLGVYLDREALGPSFRRRTGLDRFGMLARAPGRLRIEPGWKPYGETQGQSGDLRSLSSLVHELNRINEGELEGYFEDRFYLDRVISRMAAAAVRGTDPGLEEAEPPREF